MKTILIVDDDKLILSAAQNALQDAYKVVSVTSGQQALAYLESGACDIALLDVDMPEMNGFEVLEKMRETEQRRSIPVIFLTEGGDAEAQSLCFQRGGTDFIAKPFAPEVVRSRVSRTLELEDLRRGVSDKLEQKTREVFDMWSKSRQDALTGLWNRMYVEEAVNGLLERGTEGALMMIDIDNFKPINDSYGHIAGDKALKILAEVMRESCGDEDILSRVGGDEFVIFARGMRTREELSERAINLISGLREKIKACEFEVNATISVGIAQAPEDGSEFGQLYGNADKALYYVKQNGKNSYHFFSDRLRDGNSRGARTVDLKYLQDLMNRADSGTGAYLMDFESFHHVYNFIHRFIDRSNRDVQTLLFTVNEIGSAEFDAAEAEFALELLEKAIYTSLRRSDVSTRYSSKQLIVILMDANSEIGDKVAERIIMNFNKLYARGKVRIDYGIARMDSRGSV